MARLVVDDRGLSADARALKPKAFCWLVCETWGKVDHGWWIGKRVDQAALREARRIIGRADHPMDGVAGFECFEDPTGEVEALFRFRGVEFEVAPLRGADLSCPAPRSIPAS